MPGKAGKTFEPREERMLSEWLARTYQTGRIIQRVRLGPILTNLANAPLNLAEYNLVGNVRRWADAVVILPDRVVLIEAAILPDPGDVSRLHLYAELWPHTPEYSEYTGLPLELVLLTAIPDPVLVRIAGKFGVSCVQYTPDWISEYLATLTSRAQRATPSA